MLALLLGASASITASAAILSICSQILCLLRAVQVTVAVCVFAFDLLYLDGEALVKLPLRERRDRLSAALPHLTPGHVQIAHSIELCAKIDAGRCAWSHSIEGL